MHHQGLVHHGLVHLWILSILFATSKQAWKILEDCEKAVTSQMDADCVCFLPRTVSF